MSDPLPAIRLSYFAVGMLYPMWFVGTRLHIRDTKVGGLTSHLSYWNVRLCWDCQQSSYWNLWKASACQDNFILIMPHMLKANSPFQALSLSLIESMSKTTLNLQLHHRNPREFLHVTSCFLRVTGPFGQGPHISICHHLSRDCPCISWISSIILPVPSHRMVWTCFFPFFSKR